MDAGRGKWDARVRRVRVSPRGSRRGKGARRARGAPGRRLRPRAADLCGAAPKELQDLSAPRNAEARAFSALDAARG